MTTHDLTTYAGQIAHIKAVKARLNGVKKPQPKPLPKPRFIDPVSPVCPSVSLRPLWKCHSVYFNDHVMRYRMRAVSTPADWLRDRCQELGYDYKEIIGRSRKRDTVNCKHRLIYEASQKFTLSLPQLGRVFGGLDHTSILNALRRHKERMNANDI